MDTAFSETILGEPQAVLFREVIQGLRLLRQVAGGLAGRYPVDGTFRPRVQACLVLGSSHLPLQRKMPGRLSRCCRHGGRQEIGRHFAADKPEKSFRSPLVADFADQYLERQRPGRFGLDGR
jgi:hypothetical protein